MAAKRPKLKVKSAEAARRGAAAMAAQTRGRARTFKDKRLETPSAKKQIQQELDESERE